MQVITKEFMDDLGATGVEELLQYTNSAEVAGILGDFTGGATREAKVKPAMGAFSAILIVRLAFAEWAGRTGPVTST